MMNASEMDKRVNDFIKKYADELAENRFFGDFNKLLASLTISYIPVYTYIFQREMKRNFSDDELRKLSHYIMSRIYIQIVTDNRMISRLASEGIDFTKSRKDLLNQFLDMMKYDDENEKKFFDFVNGISQNDEELFKKALEDYAMDVLEMMGCMAHNQNINNVVNCYFRVSNEAMKEFMSRIYPQIVNGNIEI